MLRFAPLLALALSACSIIDGSGELKGADGTVVNQSSGAISVLAVDFESSTLIDPSPGFTATDDQILASGDIAPLTIDGYEAGDDVAVYVYTVNGQTATFDRFLSISAAEFEQNNETVTVHSL